MNPKYIIVQAGGKGSRMQSLTRNKPKALVPVNNLPMIFHLFRKYKQKKFVIIGDYKYDVLEKYLEAFADVDYTMICASGWGNTGTCAGIRKALELIPDQTEFALIWCDLILADDYQFPEEKGNYIGISKDFSCRWSYLNGRLVEEKSSSHGVAGYILKDVPENGELVRWMQEQEMVFQEQPLWHTHEYGLYSEWEKLPKMRCRPFNEIAIIGSSLVKRPIDIQGKDLALKEEAWYRKILSTPKKFKNPSIPRIYSYQPLTMEMVSGKNLYEYTDLPYDQKAEILKRIVDCLKEIHDIESIPSDRDSFSEAYIEKTATRLEKVKNMVPFAADRTIRINGRTCRNIFYYWETLGKELSKYMPEQFVLLHGDCTFSNMILKEDKNPVLFDPRGYFGKTELYGDEAYDWVKLYYSIVSNYDQFNLKRFTLDIAKDEVYLAIESNHWEDMEDEFFRLLDGRVSRKQMKLLLAVVWLSLTTYAWEDYDSICGAFYQGLLFLEEALLMSDEGTGDNYFGETIQIITDSLHSIDMNLFESLIKRAEETLEKGNKLIVSGLGKNVPVCEKFAGTMTSLGLNACFMHTNTAVHGDLGMVKKGDLVIILSKSGNTEESIYLARIIKDRGDVSLKSITFSEHNCIADIVGYENNIAVNMKHEGDMWNIMPNNSTTLNLIILQGLAMTLAERMDLKLDKDFAPNHPGGAIGKELADVRNT